MMIAMDIYLVLAIFFLNPSEIPALNTRRSPPILVPIPFSEEVNDVSFDNFGRQLLISVTVRKGIVEIEDQSLQPNNLTTLIFDSTLEVNTNDGVTSRHKVSAEAQAFFSDAKECDVRIYSMQITITAIDNEKVACPSIPQVRLFLGSDGEEKRRAVTFVKFNDSVLRKEAIKKNLRKEVNASSAAVINPTPVIFSSDLLLNDEPLLFEPAIQKIINRKIENDFPNCGCSEGCTQTDPSVCSKLPPAMRLAICAVLLCLAAFLLMLFAHVFVNRPSTSQTTSYKSSSMYARNVRVAWAYLPNYRKEVCA